MEPEELKIIAEGMGHKVHHLACEERGGVWIGKYESPEEYSPDTTNDNQCMEIMEKLKIELTPSTGSWFARIYKGLGAPVAEGGGKTINEAVCKAALEYFKVQCNGS